MITNIWKQIWWYSTFTMAVIFTGIIILITLILIPVIGFLIPPDLTRRKENLDFSDRCCIVSISTTQQLNGGYTMTIRNRMINFLTSQGFKESATRSVKYVKYVSDDGEAQYFLGRKGSVRAGRVVTGSVSVTDIMKKRLIEWEKTQ